MKADNIDEDTLGFGVHTEQVNGDQFQSLREEAIVTLVGSSESGFLFALSGKDDQGR